MFPALRDAASDPDLRGSDVRIYLFLINEVLDFYEWRPVKQVYVASKIDIGQTSVSEALQRLVAGGYLQRADHHEDGAYYRLVYSRTAESVA